MGPRLDSRGNTIKWFDQFTTLGASMGPRLDSRGNLTSGRHQNPHVIALQWGRDLIVAETDCQLSQAARNTRRFNGAAT